MASGQVPRIALAFRFPSLNSIELLRVIDKFDQEDFALLLNDRVLINRLKNNRYAIFMLADNPDSNLSVEGSLLVHEKLKQEIQIVTGQSVGSSVDTPSSINVDNYLGLINGLLVCAFESKFDRKVSNYTGDDTATFQEIEKDKLKSDPKSERNYVFLVGETGEVSTAVKMLKRHARDVMIHPLSIEECENYCVFLSFSDFSEEYGTFSGWLAGKNYPNYVHFLNPTTTGDYKFWFPANNRIPEAESLVILSKILAKAKGIKSTQFDFTDMIFLPEGDKFATVYLCKIEDSIVKDEEIAEVIEPAEPYELKIISALGGEAAKSVLKDAIAKNRNKVGYRVSIQPVPDHITSDIDTEKILDKILELEETVAQINALKAPQLRLMRFTDEQLPALIDALRSLPPNDLKFGDIKYASGHSANKDKPVHYLLYDPMINLMKLHEIIWREKTVDHSISYWLEPFVAEAQILRPTKTKVFVPHGHFLVPSLAHFGGDIDGTLKIVLGKLFHDLGSNLTEESAEPMFIFSKFNESNFPQLNLEVEIIDRRAFFPVHEQLYWMNDYLMVRGSQIVNESDLQEVALDLYQGRSAINIHNQIEEHKSSLESEWTEATNKIELEHMEIFRALISDIEATSIRIKDIYEFIAQMGSRLEMLEQIMIEVSEALSLKKKAVESLSTKDTELLTARTTFLDRLRAEAQIGEENLINAEKEISRLKTRLNQIIDWDKYGK